MPENDPNSPFFVWGRSPEDRSKPIRLATNKAWLDSLVGDQLVSALAQYAGHIHGYVMISRDKEFVPQKVSAGLMSAYALFRGLKRNLIDHDLDKRRYLYILNPVRDYGYEASTRAQRGHVAFPKPLDSVFGVYMEFDDGAVDKAKRWYGDILPADVRGVIHKWEWITPLDETDETLPENSATRYEERLW